MAARQGARKSKARKAAKKTKPTKTTPNKAMRLTFSYNGDDVKLLSQQRTEMIVPSSDALKGYERHKGFWAELRSSSDKTLYRTVMHNPTKNDAEVLSRHTRRCHLASAGAEEKRRVRRRCSRHRQR